MNDSIVHEEMPMPNKIRLEIPVGAIESDSGSVVVDIISIVAIVMVIYFGKKFVDKLFKEKR